MSNNHIDKWFFKTALGFLLTAGGLFFMYYSIIELPKMQWILYGVISSLSITIGVFLLSSAAIHKMKADLIKKQKIKQLSE